jgi:hypothetical protein
MYVGGNCEEAGERAENVDVKIEAFTFVSAFSLTP